MIELGSITINPDAITALEDNNEYGIEGTAIKCGAETFIVPAKREYVARKVLEYKLLMLRYPLSVDSGSHDFVRRNTSELRALAGLEEPQ